MRKCNRCARVLPLHLFLEGGDVCRACRNLDCNNLGRYALLNTVRDVTWPGQPGDMDVSIFVSSLEEAIRNAYDEAMRAYVAIQYFFRMEIRFERQTSDGDQSTTAIFYVPVTSTPLDLSRVITMLNDSIENFATRASGWTVSQILSFRMAMAEFRPLAGKSYIKSPREIELKRAVLNIQNKNDDNCFLYSILAAIHPVKKHAEYPGQYHALLSTLNTCGIQMPMSVSQIPKFESLNPEISINVLSYEKKNFYPIYNSTHCNQRKRHVNLLLLQSDGNCHYTLVRDMSRLVGDRSKHHGKTHVCPYCLYPFCYQHTLEEHLPFCRKHAPQTVSYPPPGSVCKFDNIQNLMPVPFALYVDFESFLKPSDKTVAEHVPSGFCCLRVSTIPEYDHKIYTYSGDDVMGEFFRYVRREEAFINSILCRNLPMAPLTAEQRQAHDSATRCSACDDVFTSDNHKVHHHMHATGQYVGPYCNRCNLQLKHRKFKSKNFIPVFIHNARSYDSHFIIRNFHDPSAKIQVIPTNNEKFLAVQIDALRFLDSFQFLSSSLDDLVKCMARDGTEKFEHTRKHFGSQNSNIYKKGIFPYEVMTGPEVFQETTLPPKEKFYSSLKEEGITNKQYTRAQKMWSDFHCKTMRDYHDLYLTLDVTLLADVFENFRNMALREYKLDPAHYWTIPGFAWDCALKMSKIELELISDPNTFLFFENSIRGGIAMVSHRYAKANNPYMNKTNVVVKNKDSDEDTDDEDDVDKAKDADEERQYYDPKLPPSYILYLDANSLYSYALSQSLPVGSFEFMEDVENFDIDAVDPEGDTGYVLEVDIQYPSHLHDDHNDYPLAPTHLQVTEDMISDYNDGRKIASQSNLIPNLYDKTNYITHIKNLQLYKRLGLVVTKIHRIVSFTQSPWLRPYIVFNINKRKVARSDFEKDFFKLMCNSVYGKSMESLRKRVNLKVVNDPKQFRTLSSKPTCKRWEIINECLVTVEMNKKKITQTKPLYTGFVVLELSKVLMYEFHYEKILKQYTPDTARLLFTDTDSLCYHIKTNDVYDDMIPHLHLYDTSGYPENHFLHSKVNKKVVGKFKDETNAVPITEFIGLRAKMYSLKTNQSKKHMRAKGVKKATSRNI